MSMYSLSKDSGNCGD